MNTHFLLRGLLLLPALAPSGNAHAQITPEACGSRLNDLPLVFVENQGQWEEDVRFTMSKGPLTARFESDAIVLCRRAEEVGAVVRLSFEGASDGVSLEGESALPGVYNFFIGDRSTWRTDVRGYESLLYRGLYDGVDLRVGDRNGELKYDVLLERAADLRHVVVRCDGVDDVRVDEQGRLVLATSVGELIQPVPETWQVSPDSERKTVECRYRRVDASRYGFETPDADPDLPLVVDPGLDWSTYLGGSSIDRVGEVVIANDGDVIACGRTYSPNFPTKAGAFPSKGGNYDAWVVRMDPTKSGGQQLEYATYLGGIDWERPMALSVDAKGVITLAGRTKSANYPVTTNAYNMTYHGNGDVFVCQLDPKKTGTAQLQYSSFIGSGMNEFATGLCVDAAGVITMVGITYSPGFPTTKGAFNTSHNGGRDLFVLRLNPNQPGIPGLHYSTFVGGDADDECWNGLSVDAMGVVTLVGMTASTNFPTYPAGVFQRIHKGGHPTCPWDAFVVQLDPSHKGSAQLLYGTYLGGTDSEFTLAGTVDRNGDVIVALHTASGDMPITSGAYQPLHANPGTYAPGHPSADCYLARVRPSATPRSAQLVAATYLGGAASGEAAMGVAVDGSGTVILAGQTDSLDFPTTPGAADETYNGGGDSFVARLDRNLEKLLYGTVIGGSDTDYDFTLAVDASVSAVIGGMTKSTKFPTTSGAFGTSPNGNEDGFLTKLDLFPTGAEPYGASTPGCHGPIAIGVNSMPEQGNLQFRVLCVNAPPSGTGYLLVSLAKMPSAAISAQGVDLWVPLSGLLPLLPVPADDRGYCEVPVPLPAGTVGITFCAQFAWLPNTCGPQQYSASNAVEVTIQP